MGQLIGAGYQLSDINPPSSDLEGTLTAVGYDVKAVNRLAEQALGIELLGD
jgi:hypothetical protein